MAPKIHAADLYQEILRTIRVYGVAMPFVVVAAGLLVKFGVLSQASYSGDVMFAAISAGFVLAASAYYAIPNPSPRTIFILSGIYHILAALFLACISGVASPLAILWVMLFVGRDQYLAGRSLAFSIAFLTGAAVLDLVLHPGASLQYQIAVVATVGFVAVVCLMLSRFRSISGLERAELARAHEREAFQRDQLVALIDSINDAVVSVNEKGAIQIYNPAILSLLDTHVELNNRRLGNILKLTDEAGKKVDLLAQVKESGFSISRDDITLRLDENEVLNLSVNVSPIRLGFHTHVESGYIFIIRDITKQKSLEEERDEFISVVSHELRTPVAIAEGNVSNVRLLRAKGLPEAAVDRALDETHEQIMYLAKMVNDLSTLSRAERGLDATPETIDLASLLGEMYRNYAEKANQKGLRLDINLPGRLPKVTTSRLYLEEILQNFITNAIKYTKAGSVTLGASATKNGVRLSVADTGIGISKSDQRHIFEKFYRSEDYRTRESSGTGLGLYVSKKLAKKIGADIGFESRLNHGSVFSLTVPEGNPADGAVAPKAGAKADAAK